MPDGADSKATVDEIIHGFLNGVLAAEPLGTLTVILGALAQKAASALDQQDANLCINRVTARVGGMQWAQAAVLSGQFRSKQGMGLGLRGIKRMMDAFEITTGSGKGTTVTFAEWF